MPVNNPGDADHITNLAADSRLYDDPPTEYPVGTSAMATVDGDAEDTFAWWMSGGTVITTRHEAATPGEDVSTQLLWHENGINLYNRGWSAGGEEWGEFFNVTNPDWSLIANKPSYLATPSTTDGHVLKIVGGVPTWAAP